MRSWKYTPTLAQIQDLARAHKQCQTTVNNHMIEMQRWLAATPWQQASRQATEAARLVEKSHKDVAHLTEVFAAIYTQKMAAQDAAPLATVGSAAKVTLREVGQAKAAAIIITSDLRARRIAAPRGVADSPVVAPQPKYGERFLYLFLSKEVRADLLTELEDEYPEIIEKFGPRFARTWYLKQIAGSIAPMVGRRVIGFLKLISLIKAVEWLVRWIRS